MGVTTPVEPILNRENTHNKDESCITDLRARRISSSPWAKGVESAGLENPEWRGRAHRNKRTPTKLRSIASHGSTLHVCIEDCTRRWNIRAWAGGPRRLWNCKYKRSFEIFKTRTISSASDDSPRNVIHIILKLKVIYIHFGNFLLLRKIKPWNHRNKIDSITHLVQLGGTINASRTNISR